MKLYRNCGKPIAVCTDRISDMKHRIGPDMKLAGTMKISRGFDGFIMNSYENSGKVLYYSSSNRIFAPHLIISAHNFSVSPAISKVKFF